MKIVVPQNDVIKSIKELKDIGFLIKDIFYSESRGQAEIEVDEIKLVYDIKVESIGLLRRFYNERGFGNVEQFLDYVKSIEEKQPPIIVRHRRATKDDIGKRCLFWDYGDEENSCPLCKGKLIKIERNKEGREEYFADFQDEEDCGYYYACVLEEEE